MAIAGHEHIAGVRVRHEQETMVRNGGVEPIEVLFKRDALLGAKVMPRQAMIADETKE